MTQKEKDLLLQDLSSRLPYGVILECCELVGEELRTITKEGLINDDYDIEEVKPMLLPLSSMTEEQKKEWQSLMIHDLYGILYHTIESFDYLYRNHIDYRGLIPKGLAKDATGLGIY